MRYALAVASVAALGVIAAAQQFPLKQNVEILKEAPLRADKVKDGLYVIRGPFLPCMTGCRPGQTGDGLIHESGDVAVRVTSEGLIVVDDKFAVQAADVFAKVKTVSPLPVKYVLNSHHHADHASGNAYARNMLGVNIIAHRNIRENFLRIKQAGEPNITFANDAAVYLGGVEVQLHWFGRGHTNGDTVIEFPDLKTIHGGDLVIDAMPVIDYPGGGSAIEFISTIDRMLTLDFDTYIPGHGRIMTKDEVRAYRARFAEMNNRMRALVRKGVTKDQMKTLDQARAQLRLADLGWDNSVSTTTWFASFPAYYDEIASSLNTTRPRP
ncbi:MAG TPA: MBL fold metallo-hydrolase [Vicinamibacterales bacterium]|nr:MBL fold metallo-hydrolase [Vicinamibacterales bacterium]